MKTPSRAAGAFVALWLLAGCTTGSTATAVVESATPPTPAPTATGSVAGEYVYQNAGLTATLDISGEGGTLTIQNRTGRELGRPGFYLLDARDGRRVDGLVEQAAPTPDGRTSTFDVAFSGLEPWNIGLVVLLIGADNYGAFVKQ